MRSLLLVLVLSASTANAQIDSVAKAWKDSIISTVIDESIPHRTFFQLFMYPHRWYVKQLLKPRRPGYDTNYIRSHIRKLNISTALAKKFYGVDLSAMGSNIKYRLKPNTPFHLGFNCSNLILNFGFYPGIKYLADPSRGKSFSRDFQLLLMGSRFVNEINYQRYRGLYSYLGVPPSDLVALGRSSIELRPELSIFSFAVNSSYVLNYKRYSLRGAFSFSEIQKRSAGSVILGIYHSYLLITGFDSLLVKKQYKENLYPVSDINDINVLLLGVSAGYGYTFVRGRWIWSQSLSFGAGAQKTNYRHSGDIHQTLPLMPSMNVNAKAALRYETGGFFCGLLFTYNNNYNLYPQLFTVQNYLGKFLFFSGYRFSLKGRGRALLRKAGLVDYRR